MKFKRNGRANLVMNKIYSEQKVPLNLAMAAQVSTLYNRCSGTFHPPCTSYTEMHSLKKEKVDRKFSSASRHVRTEGNVYKKLSDFRHGAQTRHKPLF